MVEFGAQPCGTGSILRIAALLVAHVRKVHYAPRALRYAKWTTGARAQLSPTGS